jgi:hypothetical protein
MQQRHGCHSFFRPTRGCETGYIGQREEFDVFWSKLMQTQNLTEEQKRAALEALDQAYEYWSGDALKPAIHETYEDMPCAA